MLKIKDNVDLKDLRKYGFVVSYSEYSGEPEDIYAMYGFPFVDSAKRPFIFFKKRNKKKLIILKRAKSKVFGMDISVPDNHCNRERFLDILYDLIKDGIVEKVEE